MKHRAIKLSLIGLTLFSASAFASSHHTWRPWHADAPTFRPYYIGGMLGFGEGTGKSDMGFAFGLNGGYRFNQNIAADFNFVRTPQGTGPSSGDTSSLLFGGGIKIIFPIATALDVFGKAGIGIVHNTDDSSGSADNSETHLGFLFGGGVSYHIAPQVDISAELLGSGIGQHTDTFSVLGGVSYLFG